MAEKLLYKELSYKVIGVAIEVHKTLGPGFLERIYQKAFEIELEMQKIPFKAQKRPSPTYILPSDTSRRGGVRRG